MPVDIEVGRGFHWKFLASWQILTRSSITINFTGDQLQCQATFDVEQLEEERKGGRGRGNTFLDFEHHLPCSRDV